MAKEEKPLEYERRIQDTKGLAQRIDLAYQQRPSPMRTWRRRFTWGAPALAAVASLPFLLGIGGGEKAFSNGSISRAHAIFEQNCSHCHSQAFSSVGDAACQKCHDGPVHRANAVGTIRCAECHLEHRGRTLLADVDNRHCTGCHADLAAHGSNVKLKAKAITVFRPDRHPEFSAAARPDQRPLRLNHAVHMPEQPKTIRGMKLPMVCSDCHPTARNSPRGDLTPVNFEQHCRSCHKRELEFDVFQILGAEAPPAPHTKDPKTIHEFVLEAYQKLFDANPDIVHQPLGRDLLPPPNAATWLNVVVTQSETFLF